MSAEQAPSDATFANTPGQRATAQYTATARKQKRWPPHACSKSCDSERRKTGNASGAAASSASFPSRPAYVEVNTCSSATAARRSCSSSTGVSARCCSPSSSGATARAVAVAAAAAGGKAGQQGGGGGARRCALAALHGRLVGRAHVGMLPLGAAAQQVEAILARRHGAFLQAS